MPNADPPRDGRSNRRSFSADEKLAIVQETERADETVSSVARRHGIVTSVLFRWRADLGSQEQTREAGGREGDRWPDRRIGCATYPAGSVAATRWNGCRRT